MFQSIVHVPRRRAAREPVRRLFAEVRRKTRQRARVMFGEGIDLVVGSLTGRESVYRLIDDIVCYLFANQNVRRLVDDIVEYISKQPAVRDLVQQQGAHLTDEVIDEARQNLYRADGVIDSVIAAARRRLRPMRTQGSSKIDKAR